MKARHARSLGTVVRSIAPLTPRGVAFVILAAALLSLGIIRADLAALFWGASFLVFAAYALVVGHGYRLSLARRRAREPDFFSIVLPAHAVTAGDQAEAAASLHLPRSLPPGFALHVHARLEWDDNRRLDVRIPVTMRERTARASFTAARRGAFECARLVLVASDILALTAHRFTVPTRESLIVIPRLAPTNDHARFREHTDESNRVSSRRRRGETLLEVRKYYPGDDPRRLNWKVFAHTDELFLRIGEEVPSPEAPLLFVLDTTRNPLIPVRISADYLDNLVETCGSVMTGLLARGTDLLLSLPGNPVCHSFSPESREALERALAHVWWTDDQWRPVVPTKSPHVVIFTSPGSPGLSSIMRVVEERGWTATISIKSPVTTQRKKRQSLKEILFVTGDRADSTNIPSLHRRETNALNAALWRDLSLYPEGAKEVRHAAEI